MADKDKRPTEEELAREYGRWANHTLLAARGSWLATLENMRLVGTPADVEERALRVRVIGDVLTAREAEARRDLRPGLVIVAGPARYRIVEVGPGCVGTVVTAGSEALHGQAVPWPLGQLRGALALGEARIEEAPVPSGVLGGEGDVVRGDGAAVDALGGLLAGVGAGR